MDNDKAIRAAKLTLGALMEKRRAKSAVERAQGQIAPSKYLPDVPRQVHADGGRVYPLDDRSGWYGDANYEQTGGKLVMMSPDEYLSKVRPLDIDETSRENIDDLKQHILSGRKLDPLKIDAQGREDGRHRAHAARELGIKQVPVLTWPRKADGGDVTDLGQVREQKQLQTFHKGLMGDIGTRMTQAMEAHQKAVDAGHFDGYEVGDVLQSKSVSGNDLPPMKITGRYVQKWKPSAMTLQHFDRMGAKPTIIEHEGQQYIPMLRYTSGSEAGGDSQEGSLYLDGVKAQFANNRMRKMGGLRAVKARGGAVDFMAGNHPDVPEVLYHGNAPKIATKGWTSEVDHDQTAKNIAAQDFREFRPSEYGSYGQGIYLTDKPEVASDFAQGIRADQKDPQLHGQVLKLHVSMKQPFTDETLRHPAWRDYIKRALTRYSLPNGEDLKARKAIFDALDKGTATVRDLFVRDSKMGTLVNQFGQHDIHDTIRNSGFDGIIAHRPDGSKEYVAFKPEQIKSALSATKFDPTSPDMTMSTGGYVPQKTQKAYKLFRTKGDGKLYPLFVHADKPVEMGKWLEAEEGPQGKAQGKVKSKLGDLAYRPGWHAGDLPIATHIGGKSDPSLKKPDYRPDNHVWAEVEMAADKDWQAEANSRGKGVKAHITDQVPLKGFYRYKTNPNMTGNWLIGGHMKVNRVLSDDEVKQINDAAGTADLPRLAKADGGSVFGGMTRDQFLGEPKITSDANAADLKPRALPELDDVDHEAFPLHGLRAKYSENGAAVFDGEKPVASYNFGNTLVVDPKYRKRGIGSELVYQWRSRFPQAKPSQYRTRTAQRIQEKVWDRIQREGRADGGIVERSPMFEGMSEHLMDDEGKPLELWHGTPASEPFEAFDDSKIGKRDPGFYGRGHYLTPDRGVAEGYADPEEMGRGSVMGPLHAALKNPYIWDVSDDNKAHSTLRDLQSMGVMTGHDTLMPWSNLQRHHIDRFMQNMQQRGHDGVIYKTGQGVKEIVVFNPNMIKHRDAEVGDPNDPRIMRNTGGKVDLYSKAAKIIRGLKDQPMQVEDIIKYARGKGAKQAEIDYTDLPRGGKARPSQVAQHLEDMQPQIGVQRRGESQGLTPQEDAEFTAMTAPGAPVPTGAAMDRYRELSAKLNPDVPPQYARYQLPGGQNYREHILMLDNHQGPTYTAPMHWSDTQNPLAHIRMSDRMIGNKKILHIEEMQSDWNNDARKRGFSTGTEQQDYDNFVSQMRQKAIEKVRARTGQDYYDPVTGETAPTMSPMVAQAQIEKYQRMDPYTLAMKMGMQEEHRQLAQAAKGGNGVPRAPYINPDRDDVTELAMKHALIKAAKGGYDGIAFTPDEAQRERWGGTEFNGIYNKKLPGMAQRLIRQHDPEGGSDDDPQIIAGWGAPHVELTDKARDSILQNGFASFRRGGYVTHVRRAR